MLKLSFDLRDTLRMSKLFWFLFGIEPSTWIWYEHIHVLSPTQLFLTPLCFLFWCDSLVYFIGTFLHGTCVYVSCKGWPHSAH
jgi:hypothetical protein